MAVRNTDITPKNKEQLAKWETSETNRVPSMRKSVKDSRVQFTESDVFLSACLSGDFDEVQSLLDNGADINTCTVDGLTALHQAVIDGKPEMVQFLAENGADLNAQDNEGWTPLHAAACCGNADLVAYLCNEGADISITNSDKELAVDLAEEEDCKVVLEDEHKRRNIDPDECRNMELVIMRRDAEKWLKEGCYADRPHARTGATALHVAAAKGYNDVLLLLLKAGGDVHCRDREGWTPLHAAAHWGEREAARILMEHGALLEEQTNNDETVLNVADKGIIEYLEELREKQEQGLTAANVINKQVSTNAPLKRAGSASSVIRMSTEEKTKKTKLEEHEENKELSENQYNLVPEEKSPSPSVELRLPCPVVPQEVDVASVAKPGAVSLKPESEAELDVRSESEKSSSVSSCSRESSEEKVSANKETTAGTAPKTAMVTKPLAERNSEEGKSEEPVQEATVAAVPYTEVIVRSPVVEVASSSNLVRPMRLNESKVELRTAKDGSSLDSIAPGKKSFVANSVQRSTSTSSSLPWMALYRGSSSTGPIHPAFAQFHSTTRQITPAGFKSCSLTKQPVTAATTAGSATKTRVPISTPPTEPNFPKESEAERRSKAKRQRDSRRSTQGVTKEQIKAAALAKIHRQEADSDAVLRNVLQRDLSKDSLSSRESSSPEKVSCSGSEGTSSQLNKTETDTREHVVSTNATVANVRRRSQAPRGARRGTGPVSMEDVQSAFNAIGVNQKATESSDSAASPLVPSSPAGSPLPSHLTTATATTSSTPSNSVTRVVVSLRERPSPTPQVAITHTDPPVKLSSTPYRTTSVTGTGSYQKPVYVTPKEVDYKGLYEKQLAENEVLRSKIDELLNAEKANNLNGSSSLLRRGLGRLGQSSLIKSSSPPSTSVLDEQERRNYERRIAELEFEVKRLEHVRTDNQKLKEDNGALIRVISKLSK